METKDIARNVDTRIGHLLTELMRLVNQRSAGETFRLMTEAELSMPQMVTMTMLQRCGSKSISAIAEGLKLSLAATSQLVDGLVRREYVARTEDEADRRMKKVVLLPKGSELLDRIAHARSDEMAQSMALLPEDIRAQATEALERVITHLHNLPDA